MSKKNTNISGKEHYEMLIAKKQYEQMNKPFYKKLEYWKLFITSSLTFLSVVILYKNGLFDFRSKELQMMNSSLEIKRDNLEYDIKTFSSIKDSLTTSRLRLENENRMLQIRNIQIDIANKKAYTSLDQSGKLVVQIMQKNIELERKNQSLTDASKHDNRSSVYYYSPENSISLSSILAEYKPYKVDWATKNNVLTTIDSPTFFTNSLSNGYGVGLSASSLNSSNTLDFSKYVGIGTGSRENSYIISDYSFPVDAPKTEGLYVRPASFVGNNGYVDIKKITVSESLNNKNN